VTIRDTRQFWSGALFLGIGTTALWMLPRPLGTLAAMGPGYFPMLLAIGLILLGTATITSGILASTEVRAARLPIGPTIFVLGGVLAVGAFLVDAGLAISLLLLVASSCYARILKHPLEVLAIYLAVLALTWVIFIYTIQLPINLF
jgi:Tripartite tricarboxylate transporter TctB family